jgi:hypothetical protein
MCVSYFVCRGDEEEGAIASPLQQRLTAHKQVTDNGQHNAHTCRGFRFLRNMMRMRFSSFLRAVCAYGCFCVLRSKPYMKMSVCETMSVCDAIGGVSGSAVCAAVRSCLTGRMGQRPGPTGRHMVMIIMVIVTLVICVIVAVMVVISPTIYIHTYIRVMDRMGQRAGPTGRRISKYECKHSC